MSAKRLNRTDLLDQRRLRGERPEIAETEVAVPFEITATMLERWCSRRRRTGFRQWPELERTPGE